MIINRFFYSKKLYSSLSLKIINNESYEIDSFTNITPKIMSLLNKNLHSQKAHPVCLIKEKVVQFFHNNFKNKEGNPKFSVYDNLRKIVTTEQNFDSLLIPKNHPCRSKTDCYYINKNLMLRAHMTAHQAELLETGLNSFLMIGDVYRRDGIDSSHYPVFHQLDAVNLFTLEELLINKGKDTINLNIKEKTSKTDFQTNEKQRVYTLEESKKVELELKSTLETLFIELFGSIKYRWVDASFPFTNPSWELEILVGENWIEMLGCGIIENDILKNAQKSDKIGWAFGLGLERLAMLYYSIPDIRILWSEDPGFIQQFENKTFMDKVKFKQVSKYPACPFDISFWLSDKFEQNDFYEMARDICSDIIEQILLIDSYKCKKTGRKSCTYRIIYRSFFKNLTKEEVNMFHKKLEKNLVDKFNVVIR